LGPPAETTWSEAAGAAPRAAASPGASWTFEGSSTSLETLHRRYRTRLEAIAFRILGDRADAEDVVQRIFLRLPRTRFRGESTVWTYLYRAAVNTSVNVLRSRRRRERMQRELTLAAAPVEPGRAFAPSLAAASPESRVLEGEIMAGVARALLKVKPQHRRVLVMRIVWGMSNVEIARREEIPVATVGTWLRRGRAELAREMGPMLAELGEDGS
jgi:RNA polymerase sigma-70 factor (ECF subfamily)